MRPLVAFGAAHTDRIACLDGPPQPASVPGRIRTHPGGAALNVVRHVAGAGGEVRLFSLGPVQDLPNLPERLELTSLPGACAEAASYTAIIAPDGDLVVAVSDMRAYDDFVWPNGFLVPKADDVLVDANLPAEALSALVDALAPTTRVYAMAVSAAKIGRLRPIAARIEVCFANRREIEGLCGSLDAAADMFGSVLMTDGPGAIHYARGTERSALAVEPVTPIDVTGAGDAVAGGFLAARLAGADVETAMRAGRAAAARTLAVEGPFPHMRAP